MVIAYAYGRTSRVIITYAYCTAAALSRMWMLLKPSCITRVVRCSGAMTGIRMFSQPLLVIIRPGCSSNRRSCAAVTIIVSAAASAAAYRMVIANTSASAYRMVVADTSASACWVVVADTSTTACRMVIA